MILIAPRCDNRILSFRLGNSCVFFANPVIPTLNRPIFLNASKAAPVRVSAFSFLRMLRRRLWIVLGLAERMSVGADLSRLRKRRHALHGFCNTLRSLTKRLMVEGWTRKIRATFL